MVNDKKIPVDLDSDKVFNADVLSFSDYYPFGMQITERTGSSDDYRYGFNGKEKDDEVKGNGNSIDLGDRIYDPRIGRTFKMDMYSHKFPGDSPYSFAMNTPMCAVDPDGKLIIFIGGLRLWQRDKDQLRSHKKGGMPGIYRMEDKNELYTKYWKTGKKNNAFGQQIDMAQKFVDRIGDTNAYFTSGSSTWTSQAEEKKIRRGLKS